MSNSHDHLALVPGYRFCPMCASPLETRAVEEHDPKERLVCPKCAFIFYIDPKVAVGTVVRGPLGFLVLKRSIEPAQGRWTFPGGYVDRGETLEEAAVREAEEETGVRVQLGSLLRLESYASRGIVMAIYEAEPESGEARPTAEALEVKWVAPDQIPWRELAFPSTRSGFREYLIRHGLERHVPDDWRSGPAF